MSPKGHQPCLQEAEESEGKTQRDENDEDYYDFEQIEEKVVTECTFTPQLCKTIQCHYEQPACIRLYEYGLIYIGTMQEEFKILKSWTR